MSGRASQMASIARALMAGGGAGSGAMSSAPSCMAPRAGRPAGDVSRALLCAASSAGPATVRELAERACVGYAAARYTSSRLVSRGELVPLSPARPAVLAVRSFWEEAAARAADDDGDDEEAGI